MNTMIATPVIITQNAVSLPFSHTDTPTIMKSRPAEPTMGQWVITIVCHDPFRYLVFAVVGVRHLV